MTKKDYVRIADALVQIYRHGNLNTIQEKLIITEFQETFIEDNPRFSLDKFVSYINKQLRRIP